MAINFDLGHDFDLEFPRLEIEFAVSGKNVSIVFTNCHGRKKLTNIDWMLKASSMTNGTVLGHYQWPLLLTWFNFNPSMDK